jgi:regulator of nonsense transcripts 2
MTESCATEPSVTAEQVDDATAQLSGITSSLAQQRQLRESNLQPKRPSEADLRSLESSIKRNTALIKKLKALSEDSKKALLDDVAKVNQSKYVSEAVAAIAEVPLKASDIPAAVQVRCSCMLLRQVAKLQMSSCRLVRPELHAIHHQSICSQWPHS